MPYTAEFKDTRKPFGMSDKVWDEIQAAQAEGKKVEWKYSSFTDPGGDWNEVLIEGQTVWHQDGY